MATLDHPLLMTRYHMFHADSAHISSEALIIHGVDLLHPEALEEFLSAFGQAIQSPRKEVTGSIFMKRYVSVIAGALYAFSYYDRCLDISLEQLRIVLQKDKLHFLLAIEEELPGISMIPEREERRRLLLQHMYHTNMKPVWSAIIQATGIGGSTLWATLSYLVAYWKQEDIDKLETAEARRCLEEDYRYFTDYAWIDSFADCPINPIFSRFKSVEIDDHSVLVRAKCCLQHCLPGDDRHCYTCPHISEENRTRKYRNHH
ncbi:IucA/IucC family C-terminal-domain containing protein [Paenibacillus motobuensis]|uniref:Aerobactin siderophore biosynthesis IucA/IucC-like C-terminal domain-containing protein n=1 Tax=Paenibacillus motobuensis TaxID=295324 RepID=A0ABN0Y597_9BACL